MCAVGRTYIKNLPLLKSAVEEDGSSSEQTCRLLFFLFALYGNTHKLFISCETIKATCFGLFFSFFFARATHFM